METNRIILPILPKAWIQYNHDNPIWWIPLDCRCRHMITKNPDDKGNPCENYSEENPYCFHVNEEGKTIYHTLSKQGRRDKQKIERYNAYRSDLFFLAQKKGFQIQAAGMAIYFHFPVPIRWTKKKKSEMHGQMKGSKSDCTNLIAGVEDALTGCDEIIGQYSGLGKFWFRPELVAPKLRQGYIEVLLKQPLHNPYNVILANPYKTVAMEDIVSRREKSKPIKLLNQKRLFKKEDKIK